MSSVIKVPKKLIEVALPLDDINAASSREKSIRQGHPSSLHLWWARRPLAAARAVIFAQMVNDPGYQQNQGFKYGVNKKQAAIQREKLFDIIRELIKWDNRNDEEVLSRAREAIKKSWRETCDLNINHPEATELFDPNKLPSFHDPFAGGGAIPLEAQRLGLESYASDLNPVAVMINKAMIEIPPKFADQNPVGPVPDGEAQKKLFKEWPGATGLAEDVRRYGHLMREKAYKRIGHLYPKIKITPEMIKVRPDLKQYDGQELTVIAWLWARTVKSPNPAFNHTEVPLVASYVLSSKKGKEAFIKPVVEGDSYRFEVQIGPPTKETKSGTKLGRGANFNCLLSNTPISPKYIYTESQAGNLGQRLMAVVAEGKRGRVYLEPTYEMENAANSASPRWKPEILMPENPRWFSPPMYGMKSYGDLFTPRQLVTLTTFSDLIKEIRNTAIIDAKAKGMPDNGMGIEAGGNGATAYGDALAVLLVFAIDKLADLGNSLCAWEPIAQCPRHLFGRQAIPMVWDFSEPNPFSTSSGSWLGFINGISKAFSKSFEKSLPLIPGIAVQGEAASQKISWNKVISTDPPYYDNIGYADLSDFFYVWMRRALKDNFPTLFSTLAVPKLEELVATPYRHGGKDNAEKFFMDGMTQAIHSLSVQAHPAFPVSIYYAFKQSETSENRTISTGWVTFLEAVIRAGFSIEGTWPIRTENSSRLVGQGTNALASSIVLICRKKPLTSEIISRRQFQRELRDGMPEALEAMIGGSEGVSPITPVDLAQAAIGPGMGIFSQYKNVLNQDGSSMGVLDALYLINRAITDFLSPDSGNFDSDTLFCDSWFTEFGWSVGQFGPANVLAQAKGTTVNEVQNSGVVESGAGKVRLIKWQEYPTNWDPSSDNRTPVWEALHHLIRTLKQQSESDAGELLARIPEHGEQIRQLAYHLYTLCERKNWAEDARAYNELIVAWPAIVTASNETKHIGTQSELDI